MIRWMMFWNHWKLKWRLNLTLYLEPFCRPSQNSAKTRKSWAQISTRERTKIFDKLDPLSLSEEDAMSIIV